VSATKTNIDIDQKFGTLSRKIMISSSDNALYNDAPSEWNKHESDLPNNAAGGANMRRMTEVVYGNF
jgi:hypothetical protein